MSDYRNHSMRSALPLRLRRTRFAQTASHVDLLVSLRDTRIEEDSDNSTSYEYLLVRNVFGVTFFFFNFYVARPFENILVSLR